MGKGKERFEAKDVKLWSAEEPNLYELTIFSGEEVIYERVGFRRVEVKAGALLVNGKAIKLQGVNRHEFHPKTGAAVSEENMREDLELMKSLHVNAIRTSHYPGRAGILSPLRRIRLLRDGRSGHRSTRGGEP